MVDTTSLPIRQHAAEILKAVEQNDVVVVIGETGSGKTTQLSQVWIDHCCYFKAISCRVSL